MTLNNTPFTEIERKWLLPSIPSIYVRTEEYWVKQFYSHVSDELEVRFSSKITAPYLDDTDYQMTVKLGQGLVRTEIETPINKATFDIARAACPVDPITKNGQTFELGGHRWFISKIDDWFYSAEVEFESEDAAEGFELLGYHRYISDLDKWTEVTGDPKHSMKNYWKRHHFLENK